MPWEYENRFRIATTQGGLAKGYFRDLGLIRPTDYTYLDYSALFPQSQGGQAKDGYINMLLVWDALGRKQLRLIESYVSSSLVYFTVDRSNGSSDGFDWVDLSCYVSVPQYSGVPGSRGNLKSGVQWKLNNITLLAVPASF